MSVAHRTYARALFQAAKEKGRLAQVREELGDFVAAIDDVPELDALLRNPQIDPRAKAQALEDVLGGADELFATSSCSPSRRTAAASSARSSASSSA